jgi:CDP-glucose 4,6-dehydratase
MNLRFWRGRRVFVTGHTGFKGTWLVDWLSLLGARVTGFSLDDDVRDLSALSNAVRESEPELLFHLAAQALVRQSYEDPVATFTTNLTGTVHVLETVRGAPSIRAALMVTSDKCYANTGEQRAFREGDRLGGRDPYSTSKACAELAIASYRHSYFQNATAPHVVSLRAGNVIGGGDWSRDRLIPDLVRAFQDGRPAEIRYPDATRPWQFVLDVLHGYLLVAERAFDGEVAPAFNFGPDEGASRPVRWIADRMVRDWGNGASWVDVRGAHLTEESFLAIDSTLARETLGWRPQLDAESAVAWTGAWYRSKDDLRRHQIESFMERISA